MKRLSRVPARTRAILVLGMALALTACAGRMPVREAERQCAERARLSDGIGGSVRAGVGTGGVRGGARITITDDIFRANPQSPVIVYENCVIEKSGRAPSRPLGMVS